MFSRQAYRFFPFFGPDSIVQYAAPLFLVIERGIFGRYRSFGDLISAFALRGGYFSIFSSFRFHRIYIYTVHTYATFSCCRYAATSPLQHQQVPHGYKVPVLSTGTTYHFTQEARKQINSRRASLKRTTRSSRRACELSLAFLNAEGREAKQHARRSSKNILTPPMWGSHREGFVLGKELQHRR